MLLLVTCSGVELMGARDQLLVDFVLELLELLIPSTK